MNDMTSSLTDLRPPPTLPPVPSLQVRKRPSTAGYWVAAVVVVLGLTAAFLWGAVGIHTTGDRVDGFARLAVPGATTVSVTDPGTMVVYHESAAEVARTPPRQPTAGPRAGGTRDEDHRHRPLPRGRPDLGAARAAGERAFRRGAAGRHLPVQRPLRPGAWPSRPGGGDLPGHHPGAVPGVGPRATEAGAPWPWVATSPAAWC